MPVHRSEEGSLVIQPDGDIIFTTSADPDPEDGRVELILAKPGVVMDPGSLQPKFAGQTTEDVGAVLRIRLDMKRAVILQDALTTVMLQLQGMPLRVCPPGT